MFENKAGRSVLLAKGDCEPMMDRAGEIERPNVADPWYSFRLDEQAVGALKIVAEMLPQTIEEPYRWKWVVVALHDALYGFMGLALRRSDGAQLLTLKHERQQYARWQREREQGGPIVERSPTRIDQFLNFFEKIQDPARMRHFIDSRAFVPTPDQDQSVRYLDRLRNDLVHYSDTTRMVWIAALPGVVVDGVTVIRWLVEESHTFFLHPEELEEAAIRLIEDIQEQAVRLASRHSVPSSDPAG
jgi:hypothetical protein